MFLFLPLRKVIGTKLVFYDKVCFHLEPSVLLIALAALGTMVGCEITS